MAQDPERVEVEIKARVEDLDTIRTRLLELGAKAMRTTRQRDQYLAHPSRSFEETDEALRVRVEDEQAFLTYKGPKLDASTKTRRELEVTIEDADTVLAVFEALGFTPVPLVEKEREAFTWEDVIVTLDEVDGVGSFVEVEHTAPVDGVDVAREQVLSLASKLGLERLERRSYLEMLLEGEDPGKRS